jgi:hypothetical protein
LNALPVPVLGQVEKPLLGFGHGDTAVRPGEGEVLPCVVLVGIPEPCRGETAHFIGRYAGRPATLGSKPLVKRGPGQVVSTDGLAAIAGVQRLP